MRTSDKLNIAKIMKGSNSVITCNRVKVLALSLPLSQVSRNFLLYFQIYAPDKLFIAIIKKGSKSVNNGNRVMILAFCNSPHDPLSVYQVS